ncbi:MAG TPA: hypothetical protein VK826_02515 [Bacteroidia bacterium]|nr:hypothetical protein [Bacteroidia bacterium]
MHSTPTTFKVILAATLLIASAVGVSAQENSRTKFFQVGLSLSYDVQNTQYHNIDFTGIHNFRYVNKFRWSAGVQVERVSAGGFGILGGVKLCDVGWNRLNDDYSGEPFVKSMTYTFLYLSPSIGVSKWFWFNEKFNWSLALGSDFQFRVYDSEKYTFADGHIEKDPDPRITTDKTNILFWAAVRANWQLGSVCSVGIQYLAGLNLHSFNERIISSTFPPLHSVGLTFNVKI